VDGSELEPCPVAMFYCQQLCLFVCLFVYSHVYAFVQVLETRPEGWSSEHFNANVSLIETSALRSPAHKIARMRWSPDWVAPNRDCRIPGMWCSTTLTHSVRLIFAGTSCKGVWVAQLVQWQSYGLNDWSSIPRTGREFSSPPRPDRLWGPPSLLPNGYEVVFPQGWSEGEWVWPVTSI
jgi:hypothetical protein